MDWKVAVMPKPEARKLPEGTMSEGIIRGSSAPVAANPGALSGALLLGVEGIEGYNVALIGGDGLNDAGIGVDDVLIVRCILGNVVCQVDGEIGLDCQVVAAGVVHAVDQVGVVAARQHQVELLGVGLSGLLQELNVYAGELLGLLEDRMVCHAVGEQGTNIAGNGQPQREGVAVGGQGKAGGLRANTITTVIGIQVQAGIVCLSGIFLLGRILLGGGEVQGRTDVLCPCLFFGLLGRSRSSLCSIAGSVASAAAGHQEGQRCDDTDSKSSFHAFRPRRIWFAAAAVHKYRV